MKYAPNADRGRNVFIYLKINIHFGKQARSHKFFGGGSSVNYIFHQ